MKIKSVAVFCGSKNGTQPDYSAAAADLATQLALEDINIVYGGGNKGLMGAVANAALQNGGKVTGVIPSILVEREQQHTGLTELILAENMHHRKKMMYELSDAAIILPGGFGTLDEMFEMLTWNQLSIHSKKIFVLNTRGFYNFLHAHLEFMEAEGFLYKNIETRIRFATEPSEIIEAFNAYQ